jgi:hypothetical protein
MPSKQSLALCQQTILRIWGLMVQRGWSRLILGHFRDLELSSGDSTAATREPEFALHEDHRFLCCRHLALPR